MAAGIIQEEDPGPEIGKVQEQRRGWAKKGGCWQYCIWELGGVQEAEPSGWFWLPSGMDGISHSKTPKGGTGWK